MKNKILSFIVVSVILGGFTMNEVLSQPGSDGTIVFQKVKEPRENAYSLLVPKGWKLDGGIFRIDPTMNGGSGNSIDAKNDLKVSNNSQGTVRLHFMPEMFYFDMSQSPAGQMGMFPPGSNYNGMMVIPKMDAVNFIKQVVIPYAHPGLTNYNVVEEKNAPDIVEAIRKADQYMGIPFIYTAAVVSITYQEGGQKFRETIVAATQDFGQMGAGLWKNRFTISGRAPVNEFESWAPVMLEIIGSVQINMQWLIGELKGQVQRGEIQAEVLRKVQELDNEILEGQRKTNAEINNDMFLTLTEQEEYVNPYTKKVEIGSDQWRYRWVNESGDVVYSDRDNYDPNHDEVLNRTDYKKTSVRKRYPQ
jgi:hypothetical protein